MADSVIPSAFTNPFSAQSEDQGASRLNCPSPHNPFSAHERPCSPGNPFAPPTLPSGNHGDGMLPTDDTYEPMQPMKLEDVFPFPELLESSSTATSTSTTKDVAATHGRSSTETSTATENDVAATHGRSSNATKSSISATCSRPSTKTSSTHENNVATTCDRSSESPEKHFSKPPVDFPTNQEGESSGASEWGNNANNSNHVDEAGDSGFSDGFHDDFGALSHTDVIFKTGFLDSNFKAVAVTAEEDDLWSSTFIMEETVPHRENPQVSGDLESTNQRAATPSQDEEQTSIHFVNFDSIHISGAIPEDEKRGIGLSKTPVPLEVDFLPNKEPWDPWPSEDLSSQHFAQDQTKNDQDDDLWAPITSQDPPKTENAQASCIFPLQGSCSPADSRFEADKERNMKVNPFQDTWMPFEKPDEAVTDSAMRPRALDLSGPHHKNPFSSKLDSISTSHQKASSPFQEDPASLFQDDPTSPFHPQNNLTSQDLDSSQFLFPATELEDDALKTHSDPWSPNLIQGKNGSRRSRSPNPFSPVEDSSTNPFLHDLDPLQGKLGMMHQNKVSIVCLIATLFLFHN